MKSSSKQLLCFKHFSNGSQRAVRNQFEATRKLSLYFTPQAQQPHTMLQTMSDQTPKRPSSTATATPPDRPSNVPPAQTKGHDVPCNTLHRRKPPTHPPPLCNRDPTELHATLLHEQLNNRGAPAIPQPRSRQTDHRWFNAQRTHEGHCVEPTPFMEWSYAGSNDRSGRFEGEGGTRGCSDLSQIPQYSKAGL